MHHPHPTVDSHCVSPEGHVTGGPGVGGGVGPGPGVGAGGVGEGGFLQLLQLQFLHGVVHGRPGPQNVLQSDDCANTDMASAQATRNWRQPPCMLLSLVHTCSIARSRGLCSHTLAVLLDSGATPAVWDRWLHPTVYRFTTISALPENYISRRQNPIKLIDIDKLTSKFEISSRLGIRRSCRPRRGLASLCLRAAFADGTLGE